VATSSSRFAAAFAAHADAELLDEDLAPVTRIDAIVPASALTLELGARARAALAVSDSAIPT